MTRVKAVAVQRGRWLPHLEPPHPGDARLMKAFLGMVHGGRVCGRFVSAVELLRAAIGRRREQTPETPSENRK